MPVINFTVPSTLEQRISKIIQIKGFASKAEFFRVAVISYIDKANEHLDEDERFIQLTQALSKEVSRRYRGKKIPSIKKQLSNL